MRGCAERHLLTDIIEKRAPREVWEQGLDAGVRHTIQITVVISLLTLKQAHMLLQVYVFHLHTFAGLFFPPLPLSIEINSRTLVNTCDCEVTIMVLAVSEQSQRSKKMG